MNTSRTHDIIHVQLIILHLLVIGGQNIRRNLGDAKDDGSVLRAGVTDTTTRTPAKA